MNTVLIIANVFKFVIITNLCAVAYILFCFIKYYIQVLNKNGIACFLVDSAVNKNSVCKISNINKKGFHLEAFFIDVIRLGAEPYIFYR